MKGPSGEGLPIVPLTEQAKQRMQSVDKAAGCRKALGAARVKQQLHRRRRTSASGRRNARSHTTRHVWQTTCSLGGPHGSLAACDHTYEPIDTDTKPEPQLSVAVRVFYDVNVPGCVVVLLVVRAGGCGATSSVQLAAWCGRGRRVSEQMWGMRPVPVWLGAWTVDVSPSNRGSVLRRSFE